MKKILLYLIECALSLAKTFSSCLYVLFCLHLDEIKNEKLKDKMEDEGWQKLYKVEEKAFKKRSENFSFIF